MPQITDASGNVFVAVARTSMFAKTPVFVDENGNLIYDLWEPPFEYVPQPGDIVHQVGPGEEGQLDLIAYNYYGSEHLFWIIGFVNNILHPVNEVRVGVELLIPDPEWVRSYLATLATQLD